MVLTAVLCGALIVVTTVYVLQAMLRPRKYPPGPQWLPVVGNTFFLGKRVKEERYLHAVFTSLCKLYDTSVLGLKLGNEFTVIASFYEQVHDVLTREEFEGRPDSFFFRLRTMGERRGITFTDGKLWQEQRSFAVSHLRKLGYGKQNMEQDILAEVSNLRQKLEQDMMNKKIRLSSYLSKAVLNSLWIMIAGTQLTESFSNINELLKLLEKRKGIFDMTGGKLNHMPWLRFVAPKFSGYTVITEINQALSDFLKKIIYQLEKSHQCDDIRNLIDAYLHHIHDEKVNEDEKESFTMDQLIAVCLDFFIAGSQITSTTLDFSFLVMVLYPDIQKKVRAEIHSVVGTERLPNLNDRCSLPYTEAVLMETQRFFSVAPILGPRRVLKETTLNGYVIPQEAMVLINVHSVHMDPNHWGDPHVFRPERFLGENGAVRTDDWFIPFGLGRRRCLGEVFARSCIFLYFTGLLQHFLVLPEDEEHHPNLEHVPGIIISPQPYYVRLIPEYSMQEDT